MKKIISVLLVIGLIFGLAACGGGATDKLQEQLDLGQKYLAEADYENALIAFETAIEIDDKCVEAYIGAADAYIGLGQMDKATEVLIVGLEKTGDGRIKERLDKNDISGEDNSHNVGKETIYSNEQIDEFIETILNIGKVSVLGQPIDYWTREIAIAYAESLGNRDDSIEGVIRYTDENYEYIGDIYADGVVQLFRQFGNDQVGVTFWQPDGYSSRNFMITGKGANIPYLGEDIRVLLSSFGIDIQEVFSGKEIMARSSKGDQSIRIFQSQFANDANGVDVITVDMYAMGEGTMNVQLQWNEIGGISIHVHGF